jgi:hypothetical protein
MARLWDLHIVIRDHYYHPAFEGSYSIKAVLPAVVPSLSYADLAIGDGGVAACEYARMIFTVSDWIEKAKLKKRSCGIVNATLWRWSNYGGS